MTNANVTLDAIREPLTKDLAEMEKVLQDARALLASVQEVVRSNDADVAETVRARARSRRESPRLHGDPQTASLESDQDGPAARPESAAMIT